MALSWLGSSTYFDLSLIVALSLFVAIVPSRSKLPWLVVLARVSIGPVPKIH
jgi:hypothetical protein